MNKKSTKIQDRLFFACLIGLLLLRFPVMILPCYGLLPLTKDTSMTVFEIGTYFLTAVMILLKRDDLEKYHIDRLALSLLVLAPVGCLVTQGILQRGWEELSLSIYVNAGLALLFLTALLIWRPALPRRERKSMWLWVGFTLLIAFFWSVMDGYLIHFQRNIPAEVVIDLNARAGRAVLLIFTQLSTAAALEEPLFRGFLWGTLKDRGWKEVWIWLFQTLLFTLGHIYYLGSANLSFFVIVPMGALLLGLLAWSSRSIGTSMLFHGTTNSLAGNFFALLWR